MGAQHRAKENMGKREREIREYMQMHADYALQHNKVIANTVNALVEEKTRAVFIPQWL